MTRRTWTELTASVRACHSALYTTASTVVRRAGSTEVLLVVPAWAPAELAGLATDLTDDGLTVGAGFATHAHHDHVLWHPGFGTPPRYASPGAADLAERERAANLAALGADWPADLGVLVGRRGPGLPLEPTLTLAPWGELVIHDAHSTGHAALWLPGDRVLLAGDMLSDIELPLLAETGPAAYDAGLTLLRPYVERAALLVPGHVSMFEVVCTRGLGFRCRVLRTVVIRRVRTRLRGQRPPRSRPGRRAGGLRYTPTRRQAGVAEPVRLSPFRLS